MEPPFDHLGPDQPDPRETPRTPVAHRVNRAHWFAGRVSEVLDEVLAGGMPVATLSARETAEAAEELVVALRRQHGMLLRLLGHAEDVDVAGDQGAISTGAWFADSAMLPSPAAHRLARTARRLHRDGLDATAEAALAGDLDSAQVEVVADAMAALPTFVATEDRRRAEKHLLELAQEHDAKRLKILAKHLLHVVDPDAADEQLARQLEREEVEAQRRTTLRFWDAGDGTTQGRFRIPTAHAAMLETALDALASPKRPDAIQREVETENADGERVSVELATPEVLGQAFCQLLERFPVDELPQAGRLNATVVVTMTLESLLDGLTPATLSTGERISATQARVMACQAGVIPAVLGGDGRVLDLGRKRRLFSPAQSVALAVRDRTCTAEGCAIPAAWCHAHHDLSWASGGETSLANGRLLCPRHHRMVHHPRYRVEPGAGRRVRLVRNRQ